jgi:acyl-CoA synthetase
MHIRLFDDDGVDVTAGGGPGQATCQGPAASFGYYGDTNANRELIRDDLQMTTGDIVTMDEEGYLRVVGRKSDFIIRGGKNISAAAVEEHVSSHPVVSMAAAVAAPDAVFGERVCVFVVLAPDASLELPELAEHMISRGVTKEIIPEHLVVVDELPRASGEKVAKSVLRAEIARRLGETR